jgi:hypothetical protein
VNELGHRSCLLSEGGSEEDSEESLVEGNLVGKRFSEGELFQRRLFFGTMDQRGP